MNTGRLRVLLAARSGASLATPAGAGLSKLNSMLGLIAAFARPAASSNGENSSSAIQPGSVDMLGPIPL